MYLKKNTKSKAAILFSQGQLQRKDSLAEVFAYGRRGVTEWQKGLWIEENHKQKRVFAWTSNHRTT